MNRIKELELTCTLRNNRLKERRVALGMNRKQLAEAAGVTPNDYGRLEALKGGPYRKDGSWAKAASRLSLFFRVPEEDLFPPVVVKVKQPEVVRTLDEGDIQVLLTDHQQQLLMLPDEIVEQHEAAELVRQGLHSLSVREETIIRQRFGLDSGDMMTLEEVGKEHEICRGRVRQIEAKALRKLRHPRRLKCLPQPD